MFRQGICAVVLLAATMLGGGVAKAADVRAGHLVISGAWSRALPPTVKTGVVYLDVRNDGDSPDALTGMETPIAGNVMIHETKAIDGVMKMAHVMRLEIPAGATISLAPGGYHGMLMDLKAVPRAGESFDVVLHFEKAGDVRVPVAVR